MITIDPVRSEADKRAFYDFAWRVYRDDPHWVPHLWPQRKEYLDKKAAFFSYGEGEFWLARRDKEIAGTIGTAIDHPRNQHMGWKSAVFGFFEVLSGDYEAASTLWDHACQWAHSRGLSEVIGPYHFGQAEDPGFLVEGFDCPPALMMGHTPPYYADFARRYGFRVFEEDVAYRYDLSQIDFDVANGPPIVHRIAERALQRHGSTVIRTAHINEWEAEAERLRLVYNKSLAVLPEFAPMEAAEFRAQAQALKPILDPDLVFVAEVDGKVIGFALGMPNLNEVLIRANGLRYPWDYLGLALAQGQIRGASFKILAIDPDYWGYGLEALMFLKMGETVIRKGFTWIDASLTNLRNPQTTKLAKRLGARIYRRYHEFRLIS